MNSWYEITINAFQEMWQRIIYFLPNVIWAIIVLLIGWGIAIILGRLVERVIKAIKIDLLVERSGLHRSIKKAGVKINIAHWLGLLTEWFFIFVFLLAASDILKLEQFSVFLNAVLNQFLPDLIVASIVLAVGIWAGRVVGRIIENSIALANVQVEKFTAAIAKWAIYIFTLIFALTQLGITPGLLQTIIAGIVAMVALAGGLAFGLGGKEYAQDILEGIKNEIRHRGHSNSESSEE